MTEDADPSPPDVSPWRDRAPLALALAPFVLTPAVLFGGPGSGMVFRPFVMVAPLLAPAVLIGAVVAFVLGAFSVHKLRIAVLSVTGGMLALCGVAVSTSWISYGVETIGGVRWVVMDTGHFSSDGFSSAWWYHCNAVQVCSRCRSAPGIYTVSDEPRPTSVDDCARATPLSPD